MPNTHQLSVTAHIGLTLGCVLLFSIILTLVGSLAADEVRQKMASFASEGVVASGTITDKRIVRTTERDLGLLARPHFQDGRRVDTQSVGASREHDLRWI